LLLGVLAAGLCTSHSHGTLLPPFQPHASQILQQLARKRPMTRVEMLACAVLGKLVCSGPGVIVLR
jgi:hypothetical protein